MLGFGAFVWICRVLLERNYKPDTKLEFIHVRALVWCFVFLFIVRCLVLGIILLPRGLMMFCMNIALILYINLSFIFSIDNFLKHKDRWEDENKLTLLDVKRIYIRAALI